MSAFRVGKSKLKQVKVSFFKSTSEKEYFGLNFNELLTVICKHTLEKHLRYLVLSFKYIEVRKYKKSELKHCSLFLNYKNNKEVLEEL